MKVFVFLSLLFLSTLVSAAELVTDTHLLKPQERVEFYPKRGESLSIVKDLTHYVPKANYDIVMRNGQKVYFEKENQTDDIYIIFNEDTSDGDVVFIKVNEGYFTYTTQSFHELPTTVRKILKASKKRNSIKTHVDKEKNVIIESEEFCFDANGEIVDCKSPAATINQPQTPVVVQPFVPTPPKTEKVTSAEQTNVVAKKSVPEEKKENLFTSFAQKLKLAFAKITENLKVSSQKEESITGKKEETNKTVVSEKQISKTKTEEKKIDQKEEPLVLRQKKSGNIDKYNRLSDQEIKAVSKSSVPKFYALPQNEQIKAYEKVDVDLHNLQVVKPRLQQKLSLSHENISAQTSKPQMASVTAPVIARNDVPETPKMQTPQLQPKTLSQPASVANTDMVAPPSITLPKVAVPAMPVVSKNVQQTTPSQPSAQVLQRRGIEPAPVAGAQEVARVTQHPPVQQPDVEIPATVVTEKIPKGSPELEHKVTVVEAEDKTKEVNTPDKIVITKIISQKQPQTAAPLERMSDRVIGGGSAVQDHTGTVSVKAYSNRKPISAWVEVYKGKRRVKTFYTNNGKEVKLPAGTYIMKATYRTGTAKQKKSLGKIHLQEGEKIKKRVYFNVGKLNVVAKRRGEPVYVKVEIYKKGSRSRYAYTFSSRSTGEAHLQLSEGSYKIIVLEHGKKKVFDNVRIKGGATKTIRVDF